MKYTLEQRKQRINELTSELASNKIALGQEFKETREEHTEAVPRGKGQGSGPPILRMKLTGQTWENWCLEATGWDRVWVNTFIRVYDMFGSAKSSAFNKTAASRLPMEVLNFLARKDTPAELRNAVLEVVDEKPKKMADNLAKNSTGITQGIVKAAKEELKDREDKGEVISFAKAKAVLKKEQVKAETVKVAKKAAKKEKASPVVVLSQCCESAMVYLDKATDFLKTYDGGVHTMRSVQALDQKCKVFIDLMAKKRRSKRSA